MALTIEQLNANRAKAGLPPIGATPKQTQTVIPTQTGSRAQNDFVSTMVSSMGVKQPAQPDTKKTGFLDRIGQERGAETVKSIRGYQSGQQTLGETGLQVSGQVLGGASDVFGAALLGAGKALLPKSAEKKVADVATRSITSLLQTRPGQAVSKGFAKLEDDTRTTRNIKGLLGSGAFAADIAGAYGAKAVAKPAIAATKEANIARKTTGVVKKIEKTQSKALKLYEKATDVAPTSKRAFENRFKESFAKYLVDEQIPIELKPNRTLDTGAKSAAQDRLKQLLDTEELGLQQILRTKQGEFNIADIAARAINETADEIDANAIRKAINNFILPRKKKILNPSEFNSLKRKFNKFYDGADSAKSVAARKIQSIMRDELLKAFPEDDVLKNLLARMSKHLEARDVLVRMSDKVIRGGKLGKQLNQIIGSVAFGKVPVFGPILGYELAGKITDYLNDATRLTQKAIKELQAKGIVPKTLQKRDDVLNYLKNDLEKKLKGLQERPLMLPQASGKETGPFQIPLPNEGVLEGQRNIKLPTPLQGLVK